MSDPKASNDQKTQSGQHNDSRRAFLAQTAALAGVAGISMLGATAQGSTRSSVIVPSVKASQGSVPKQGETIRLAIIGTGGMGGGHLNSIIALAKTGKTDTKIVALADVCDSRLEGAKKVAESKQGITVDAYRDYREILKRDDIHGVLIASPEHWHAQHIIDSLTAGKDVYAEKPMTLRLDEAQQVVVSVELDS